MRTLLLKSQTYHVLLGMAGAFTQWIYEEDGVIHRVETPGWRSEIALDDLPTGPLDTHKFMPTYDPRWPLYNKEEEDIWIKKARLIGRGDGDATAEAEATAREMDIRLILDPHPHPNLCNYYGCIVDGNLVSGLVYERMHSTLYQARLRHCKGGASATEPPHENIPVDVGTVMRDFRAALDHLRTLNLVYVDITPHNIMWLQIPRAGESGVSSTFRNAIPPEGTYFEHGVPGAPGWMSEDAHIVDETIEPSLRLLEEFLRTGKQPCPEWEQ